MSRFYVKVEKIKNDPMGKITKTSIVNNQPFASIDHLLQVNIYLKVQNEALSP